MMMILKFVLGLVRPDRKAIFNFDPAMVTTRVDGKYIRAVQSTYYTLFVGGRSSEEFSHDCTSAASVACSAGQIP